MVELTTLDIVIRMLIAVGLAGLLGIDREKKHKTAGISTNILLAIGTCALAIAQVMAAYENYQFIVNNDIVNQIPENQRLIAQVITGIGFLGAGAIFKNNEGIKGLTTAAYLWISGVIGLVVGLGYLELGVITALIALILTKMIKTLYYRIYRNAQ